MSQCVPNWDLDDAPTSGRLTLHPNSTAPDETTLDYEVAELTWKNGHLVMHGLGPPRIVGSKAVSNTASKYTWEKQRASGTLEAIVNQATRIPLAPPPPLKSPLCTDELVPWFDHQRVLAHPNLTMDALVPCSKPTTTTNDYKSPHVPQQNQSINTCSIECSTRVGSCSGAAGRKHMMDSHVPVVTQEGCSRNQSASSSATYGGEDSRYVTTVDTCEKGLNMGFTSTSLGSLENTSSGKQTHTSYTTTPTTGDDHDSVCHSTPQKEVGIKEDKKKNQTRKSSVSTKRSRAAAIHNQSERKRRDKINQKMKTLQKLVPNSSKTDKASMLDEVIEYLKQLQAHVQMMNRMSMSQMMLPITMQQQLQMSMMSQMGMGVGMGMGMGMGVIDMNSIARPTIPGIPPLMHPAAFMHLPSWDNSGDHRLSSSGTVMPDPLSSLLACQTQPMTMDAYSRMAALYQQLASNPKTWNLTS